VYEKSHSNRCITVKVIKVIRNGPWHQYIGHVACSKITSLYCIISENNNYQFTMGLRAAFDLKKTFHFSRHHIRFVIWLLICIANTCFILWGTKYTEVSNSKKPYRITQGRWQMVIVLFDRPHCDFLLVFHCNHVSMLLFQWYFLISSLYWNLQRSRGLKHTFSLFRGIESIMHILSVRIPNSKCLASRFKTYDGSTNQTKC